MITKEQMIKEFEKTLTKNNNQWQRGVIEYAKEFLNTLEENYNIKDFATEFSNEQLMNNASSPKQHSNSGNTLISNYDIANRLYSPSVAKTMFNKNLLEVQTKAIYQALILFKNSQHNLLHSQKQEQK